MGMIGDALEYFSQTVLSTDVAGVAITYQIDADSISMNALPVGQGKDRTYAAAIGSRPSEAAFELMPPERGYCGFLIRVDALQIDGVRVTPDRGHRILVTKSSGVVEIYDVVAPKGMLPWRDEETLPHRIHYRVHTKYKGVQ